METEPPASNDSTPPEPAAEPAKDEPVTAVPTSETTPVWAHTVPVAPAESGDDVAMPADEEQEALPALPMQKGDPDWSKTDPSANGEGARSATEKPTPAWAQTVQTSPGEPIPESAADEPEVAAPVAEGAAPAEAAAEPAVEATAPPEVAAKAAEPEVEAPPPEPPKEVAAAAVKKTWPPAAEAAPAPPEETDIWPPEPPTERAMPAWPPPSELEGDEAEPASGAQAIPGWPESFDATAAEAAAAAPAAAPAPMPPTLTPAPPPHPVAASAPPAPPAPKPVAPAPPTPSPAPTPPAQPGPVAPAQSGPAARPAWAPGPVAEPATHVPVPDSSPMQVPAWAPRVPLASEPGTPTWFSPKEAIPHPTTTQPATPSSPAPAPTPPVPIPPGGGHLPVAPVPAPAAPAQPGAAKPAWQVVEQHTKVDKGQQGPTAEDRSYAEWFAWAKRGGAPASACHAAAQGAFKALSSGKDVTTAVQWATAAMSRPPEQVSYTRQTYCAWFSLATIELNLDQHRSHAFATAALYALDAGQDAAAAHAAGLAAAGIR